MVTSHATARGLDFARLCVGRWQRLITEPPPSHRRLTGCVGARAVPPGLLRMSMGCVTCGCHGDAVASAGRAETNALNVGAKSSTVVRLTQFLLRDALKLFIPFLPREAAALRFHAATR